ncbi:MAG: nucleotidyltransferase family protein [Gammaproteobacteria bacterium]|jgi:N-acetyl-alpha-D-muramate 1-phosphate uridylyltransferase|nr:nucleotidyltransferase family protein [Gammaproteobacteria bacterium]
MKAMLLAAGLGKRLMPITNTTPKPMLEVAGKPLIEHHLERLRKAGIEEVIINVHHLGGQIQEKLGDGTRLGVKIQYSVEAQLLETGGGIKKALPMLGDSPFLVASADTYLDFDLGRLPNKLPSGMLGLLVMTNNPEHHPEGDYASGDNSILQLDGDLLTYTGTGILHPDLVRDVPKTVFMLRQVFDDAVRGGKFLGIEHDGYWCDVGTESRLKLLRKKLDQSA